MNKVLYTIAAVAILTSLGYNGAWVSAQEGVKPAAGVPPRYPIRVRASILRRRRTSFHISWWTRA